MDPFTAEYDSRRIEIDQLPPSRLVDRVTEIYDKLHYAGEKRLFYGNNYGAILKEDPESKTSELIIMAGEFRYTLRYTQEGGEPRFSAGYINRPALVFSKEGFNQLVADPNFGNYPVAQNLVKELKGFLLQYATVNQINLETFRPTTEAEWNLFTTYLIEADIIRDREQWGFRYTYEYLIKNLPSVIPEGSLSLLQQALTEIRKPEPPPELPEKLKYESLTNIKITPETEESVVTKLENDPPMTLSTDQLTRDYFVYIYNQMSGIEGKLNTPDFEGVVNRLTKFVEDYIRIVTARGRQNSGQIGDWFWTTSQVANLAHVQGVLASRFLQLSKDPRLVKAFGNA